MSQEKWHTMELRIIYKDTDLMGVVYYANYFTFFEKARTEYMRNLGYPYLRLEKEGLFLPVIEASAQYRGNVGYDSLIILKTRVSSISRVTVRFDYQVLDDAGKIIITGHTVHAVIGINKKPSRLPEDVKKTILSFQTDLI